MKKLIRITTVPISLNKLLEGQLRFMGAYYQVIAVSSGREELLLVGAKEEVSVHHVKMTRKITPLKDLMSVIRLYKFLKKEKPYIVHTHTPKAGIVGMLASYLAKTPNRLHTVAGMPLMEATGLKRKLLNFVEKLTYGCATKVYPNSYGLKNVILEHKFAKAEKLKVIANGSSNGIDTTFFNPDLFSEKESDQLKHDLKIKEDDFLFIFVGRVVGDKGVNELVEAFNKLSNKYEQIKLLLIGPIEVDLDPLLPKTTSIIDSNKQIISIGYQEDVRLYFAIADVLTFPSYREGFPNVVMQACAMGLPCIVSDINGCNEIIENNKNGDVIPVKNTELLYETMKKYIDEPGHLAKMKKDIRNKIKDNYEREMVCQALLNEYKSLKS